MSYPSVFQFSREKWPQNNLKKMRKKKKIENQNDAGTERGQLLLSVW